LASGSWDFTIKLWSLQSKNEIVTLRGHNSYIFAVAFSADGKHLASGSGDKSIKLWDVVL
jgi:WD40 repeat protein